MESYQMIILNILLLIYGIIKSYKIMFSWADYFSKLRQFVRTKKRFPLEEDGEIYNWFDDQRKNKNLEEKLVAKLDSLLPEEEIKWDGLKCIEINTDNDLAFISMYRKLLKYTEMPDIDNGADQEIISWIRGQYHIYSKKRLREDRLNCLESIPYWNWEDAKFRKRKIAHEQADTDDESEYEPVAKKAKIRETPDEDRLTREEVAKIRKLLAALN